MRLRFARRAIQDLNDISDYLRARHPAGAVHVRAAIFESLRNLTHFPKVGRKQNVEGVRRLVARKYPYLIYYMIDEAADEIIIVSIQHSAREREFSDI